MSGKPYTEEFKIAAVEQVAERGHPIPVCSGAWSERRG